MKKIIYAVLFVVILLFGVTFTIENPARVDVNYLFDLHWNTRLAWVVVISLAAGVGLGFLGSLGMVLSAKRQLARKRKELKAKEQEILNLRSLPLKDVV
jgi:uncharacterized membrane protein YciS (DUF1049 family)